MEGRTKFILLFVIAQFVGLLAVLLMGIWMGKYLGGFAWYTGSPTKFNYHPFFLTLGLIFIYGDAILVYRLFNTQNKLTIKIVHTVLQFAALLFTITGVQAVFSAHADTGSANLYSIHGWIGITTVFMFALQFTMGFFFYLFPGVSDSLKTWYMSAHRYWGVAIFVMAIATALIGSMEEVGFKIPDYNTRTAQAYVVNFMAMSLVVFGWLVTYLVSKPEYKRDASGYANMDAQS
ncbi:transmembrane ascorbate-dependent reductase CYB561-like [Watersipora subatra]|uniref:transmembrane ascorbate-dependent reductase CYB561-like n=1 Tax=Watersipora subatra TaxID=2589382 RepID=UPI00355B5CA3